LFRSREICRIAPLTVDSSEISQNSRNGEVFVQGSIKMVNRRMQSQLIAEYVAAAPIMVVF
jgi:hypothetical protein